MPLVEKKKKGKKTIPTSADIFLQTKPSIAHPSLFETSQTLSSVQDDARTHWPTKTTAKSYVKPHAAVEL